MNKKLLLTPVLALALIVPGTSFAHNALADTDGTDTSGSSTTVGVGADAGVSAFGRLKNRLGANGEAELHDGHLRAGLDASTTPGERHGNGNGEARHDKQEAHAGTAIDTRIDSLNKLSARIGGSKMLSSADISSIQASLSSEVSALVALKAKIGSDTATTTLKADIKSITQSVRVYLLVEPKARIAAAAGRMNALADQFTLLSTKLDARITAAANAGKDVTAARASLSDMNAKVADAKTQADAAVSLTANLTVDNGDKTLLSANIAALKSAREKLKAAEADFKAARKDAGDIISSVKGVGVTASSTTSVDSH